ncbi:TraB/GumN family protein [Flavobacterium hydatis]|uniref:Polysaccharide biosynthesis protein GumN n=1 Tax=Flavobacterium hydatis TaxID=991 RepID=A0A086AF63_FLAHY|nr:TraB/GumN family protein [Flavobacterium hydatis]KFF15327.1 polysaccharide biosynthesis protein GumN [Flavobacterium hydatis]OXA98269.1 TraB/GumN family protein [Flavobacterium hydatis]
MENLIKSTVVAIAIFFTGTIQAQDKSPKLENSLLWEVSGNGLSKSSYLYGTIHSICSDNYFLSEKTKKAFQNSDKLMLEINFSDPEEMEDAQKLAMSPEPLSKKLTPEQLSELDLILQKSTGYKIKQVDNFSLATVMSLISIKTFDCENLKSYENDFIALAQKDNKKIDGLETVKGQLAMLSSAYSDSELIAMLQGLSKEKTKEMVNDYVAENIVTLYNDMIDEKEMSKKAKNAMLDERNLSWAKELPETMKKESVFVAVGSAHLAGELGVINLLRKAGYKVKPVMN